MGLRPFLAASLAMISNAALCCFLTLEGSTCPLRVGAGQIQPSTGLFARSHKVSRVARTLGVIGTIRVAATVLPCVTNSVPWRPFTHPIDSQRNRKHSSGLSPVSDRTVATEAKGGAGSGSVRE
jgi:hypothetical protein